MDSLTFNKIAAGILVALLLVMGIGKLGSSLYGPAEVEHAATETEAGGEEMAADEAGAAAPAEEPGMSLAALLNVADPAAGEAMSKKCASCHTFDNGGENRVGPNQWGVVGGPVAGDASFAYSDAMASLGGTWTFEALDAFIKAPKTAVPGTKMTFAGIADAEDRANLIVWMNQQSDSPIALPPPPAEEPVASEAVEATEDAAADAGETASTEDTETAAASGGDDLVAEATDAVETVADDAAEAVGEVADDVADAADDTVAAATGDAAAIEAQIAAASPEDGEAVMRKCKSCHTFDQGGANRVGPNMWGVVGRPVASHEGYSYSTAMQDFGGEWTYERLWTYLHDPKGVVPGTKMAFAGIKDDADIAALLAWLRLQADTPVPLAGAQ